MADDETNDQETGDDVEETDDAGPDDDDLEDDSESASGDSGDGDDANSDGDDDAGTTGDGDEKASPRTKRGKTDDEEDDDDDVVDDDDVEADLDRILKDRMVTAEEEAEEEETGEPTDRSEGGDRLQPKQQDEQLCSSCFLLVRSNAPGCPVGDDNCPIFS